MARLPRTGSASASLCERTPAKEEMIKAGLVADNKCETTLDQLVADLGLKPLSADEEQFIRARLGFVIGQWITNTAIFQEPDSRLLVKDVQISLVKIANGLDQLTAGKLDADRLTEIEQLLQGAETGFRHIHDSAVAFKIIDTLAQEVGCDKAMDLVKNFRYRSRTVAEACRRASKDLKLIKGRTGRPTLDWYRGFKDVLTFVAEKNEIPITVTIDPATGRATGSFIDLAMGFEGLLPGPMGSRNPETCARRLKSHR